MLAFLWHFDLTATIELALLVRYLVWWNWIFSKVEVTVATWKRRPIMNGSYLQLVGMQAHQPLHAHPLTGARVVDVLGLPQATLIHSHVCQLTKTSCLLAERQTKKQTTVSERQYAVSVWTWKSRAHLQFVGQTDKGLCGIPCRVHLDLWALIWISTLSKIGSSENMQRWLPVIQMSPRLLIVEDGVVFDLGGVGQEIEYGIQQRLNTFVLQSGAD